MRRTHARIAVKKILVIAPAWVGDAVLAQPLFMRLRARDPALQLDVLAPAWTHALFARMPEVDTTLTSPFAHGELAWGRRRTLAREIAARGYDEAIVLPNSFKSALVPWFAQIPHRTGYIGEARFGLVNDARRLDKRALPLMVERFAALAAPRGAALTRPLPAPRLVVNESSRNATLGKLGLAAAAPVAVLCPGAEYGPAKRWPAPYFAALAGKLAAAGYAVWLAGSANDAATGAEIARLAGSNCINLCGRTTLAEAIDLLSGAAIVISNDSGLMHVAAALERPLVALFGSSSPAFTPPAGARSRVVRLELPCSPCFKRACPLGPFDCMMRLTPDAVWPHIERARTA